MLLGPVAPGSCALGWSLCVLGGITSSVSEGTELGGGLPQRWTGLRPTTQEREAEAGRTDGKGSK